MNRFDRITSDPAIQNGQPCIRGSRLTVRRVLDIVATYDSRTEIRKEFPELEDEDISQALAYASAMVADEEIDLRPPLPRVVNTSPFTTGILLDQGLPRSAVRRLAAMDVPCAHVSELGMAQASDPTILDEAAGRGWTVVTLDSDFHRLLALSGADKPSVIHLRLTGLRTDSLMHVLHRVYGETGDRLRDGAAVTVTTHRVRVRPLPI